MAYQWNKNCIDETVPLPALVADKALRLASRTQFKVLLWFARHTADFSVSACAGAIGETEENCADAMLFWKEMGIVSENGAPVSAPMPPLPPLPKSEPAPERPRRPQMTDVIRRQKNSQKYRYLLQSAEKRVGRPLTSGEMETFLYIYDDLHLPAEVILMILVNAVDRGKMQSRSGFASYLEKVAISWADSGINTVKAAEKELLRLENRDRIREHIRQLFSLDRTPTLLQVDAAVRWIDEWHFSDEVLSVAYRYCVKHSGSFHAGYMSRILEGWHADGITTPEAAENALSHSGKSAAKPLPSGDPLPAQDDYERAAAAYLPKYKK